MWMNNKNSKSLTTIERSFEIIELIMEMNGARVSEIADTLDLPRSTVHNYLGTLRQQGYLVKEGDEYRIGLRFLWVGGHAASQYLAYQQIRHKVNQLAQETNERVQFIAEENGQGIYVFEMASGDAVQTDVRIGKCEYLHTIAAGKAILAHLPESRVKKIIGYWGLPEKTENTITDEAKLFHQLEEIRERGFAINDEERIMGQRAVGVPIFNELNNEVTAISLSSPTNRMKGDWFKSEIPNKLLGVANEIELNLQFSE